MLGKRLVSFFRSSPASQLSSNLKPVDEEKSKTFGLKAVFFLLINVTVGVALSALDDLAIYQGCSRQWRMPVKKQTIKNALGKPIVKGPWYNASLAVAHKRHSVSCTFPESGPHGNGVFQLKAICNGDKPFFLSKEIRILHY